MSSRALRKARELELLNASKSDTTPAEVSESEDEPVPAQKPSLFALLGIADERDASVEEEEEEEEDPEPEPSKPVAKKPKKKKKKGKGKAKAGKEDDIDQKSGGELPLSSVLKIDSRDLDAGNEMKKLFGKDALRPGDSDGQGEGGGRRRVAVGRLQLVPGAAGGRSLNKGRRNTFVQPKDEWPNVGSGGLGMEIDKDIEDSDLTTGITTYRFVHGRAYQSVQREFMICVASMDPNRMILLLQHNPYHITTLLQCSEIFHHQRDFTIAGDLLERALFSLGRSLHSSFPQKLAEGTARLSFRRPENRELFLCGWRYIKNLSQRGTWRTAEEFARLLLAMDPKGDPYEMSLIIDFLALKSRQPERLLSLTEHSAMRQKYSDLPNIAFSSALAHLQLGNPSTASEYLSKAITKFPWIPSMLYKELQINSNLPPALWAAQPPEDNPRQRILANLYVERIKDIWKQPAFTTFLVDTASSIYNLPRKPLLSNASKKVSLSLTRHVILTDISAITALLPRGTRTSTNAFDPLPPDDDLQSYDSAPTEIPGVTRAREMGLEMRPGEGGLLSTFLMSLLPWFRAAGEGEIEGRRLTEEERGNLADLRRELERAGVDVERLVQEQAEEERTMDRLAQEQVEEEEEMMRELEEEEENEEERVH
ncbi:transcriptional repressor TCF25-domain-containing protein [Trichophaea hybrida]|nr:transcriptional repressor TCF25-domain-containing protein [Trichophaea hybrida]